MKLFSFLSQFSLTSLLIVLSSISVKAAEKVHFIYGPLNLSLKVESLALFAEEGIVNPELDYYLKAVGADEEQKEQFREALQKKAEIDPRTLWRILYSPTGEQVLERMGVLISGMGGRNGKYLLRGALIQSAYDEEKGLTLVNFLDKLATDVQLNIEEVSQVATYVSALENGTGEIIKAMAELSEKEAKKSISQKWEDLPDIRQNGSYGVAPTMTWELVDIRREQQRKFKVLVVTPEKWRAGQTPVVVISHG